jgi:hypothetical protein
MLAADDTRAWLQGGAVQHGNGTARGGTLRPSTTNATGRPSSTLPGMARTTTMRRVGEELPPKLGDEEWENEVARNVLTLYVSAVKDSATQQYQGGDGAREKGQQDDLSSTKLVTGDQVTLVEATTYTSGALWGWTIDHPRALFNQGPSSTF